MTDAVSEKLDELIAVVRASSVPDEFRWLSAKSAAAMLDMEPRQFAERVACLPSFPKPARPGHPRWKASEIDEWMRTRRDELQKARGQRKKAA